MKSFKSFISEQPIHTENSILKDKFLNTQSYLLCPPYSLSIDDPNNVWMNELKPEERKLDLTKAINQWLDLYNCLASETLVYLLPPTPGLQDQAYVANLGITLPHTKKADVVISNYTSKPRIDEAKVGLDFFRMLGYTVHQAPFKFEGEADLKYLYDNIYIGGHGIRTSIDTHKWFEQEFDMKVIPLKMTDEYLYHLDCLVFPLNVDNVLICTEIVDKKTIKEIEKVINVIDVDYDSACCGIANSVRCGSIIYTHSNIHDMKVSDENYADERKKVDLLTKICEQNGFEPVFINISEFTKSGALMSCLVFHMNYTDFNYSNT